MSLALQRRAEAAFEVEPRPVAHDALHGSIGELIYRNAHYIDARSQSDEGDLGRALLDLRIEMASDRFVNNTGTASVIAVLGEKPPGCLAPTNFEGSIARSCRRESNIVQNRAEEEELFINLDVALLRQGQRKAVGPESMVEQEPGRAAMGK